MTIKVAINCSENVTCRKKEHYYIEESLLKAHFWTGEASPDYKHDHAHGDEEGDRGHCVEDFPNCVGERQVWTTALAILTLCIVIVL